MLGLPGSSRSLVFVGYIDFPFTIQDPNVDKTVYGGHTHEASYWNMDTMVS